MRGQQVDYLSGVEDHRARKHDLHGLVLERHGLDRFLVDADNNDYDGYQNVDGWLFYYRRVFFRLLGLYRDRGHGFCCQR